MVGPDVVVAVFIACDGRDRVGLDDQVLGQAARLLLGDCRGRLIWVSDGDQVRSCLRGAEDSSPSSGERAELSHG